MGNDACGSNQSDNVSAMPKRDTGDDTSSNFAEEGDFAKDDGFATTGNFAKDGSFFEYGNFKAGSEDDSDDNKVRAAGVPAARLGPSRAAAAPWAGAVGPRRGRTRMTRPIGPATGSLKRDCNDASVVMAAMATVPGRRL